NESTRLQLATKNPISMRSGQDAFDSHASDQEPSVVTMVVRRPGCNRSCWWARMLSSGWAADRENPGAKRPARVNHRNSSFSKTFRPGSKYGTAVYGSQMPTPLGWVQAELWSGTIPIRITGRLLMRATRPITCGSEANRV